MINTGTHSLTSEATINGMSASFVLEMLAGKKFEVFEQSYGQMSLFEDTTVWYSVEIRKITVGTITRYTIWINGKYAGKPSLTEIKILYAIDHGDTYEL